MTSNAKSTTCDANTRAGKSCRTSAAGSTGNDGVFGPFFDDACKVISDRWRWHTKTVSPDSATKSSNSCWENVESNCCATTRKFTSPKKKSSSTISYPSSRSSALAFTANVTTQTTKRVRKLVLDPPKDVAQKLKAWMGCCRKTYNDALAYTRRQGVDHEKTFYWLRNRFVNESNVPWKYKFLLQTPKHVREGAVKDLSQAYAINFKVKKKNPNHRFDIRFRKKKDAQSIVIPKTYFKILDDGTATFYPTMLTPRGFFKMTSMPTSDCRLSTDRLGRWILYVPTEVHIHCPAENQGGAVNLCSVDPGVRTFLTTWSTNEEAYKLGDGDSTKLFGMLLHIDRTISKASKATGRSRWRIGRAANGLRQRFENVVRDLHYQCANFLTTRYQAIIIPAFGSKKMSSKMDRRLTTKTVRSMLGLGHYAFRQRLLEVAERRGVRVAVTTEEYTSMTCSCCGELHRTLGSSKTFTCPSCGYKVDRDLQGAFNIFLKFIHTHPGDVLVTSMGEAPYA